MLSSVQLFATRRPPLSMELSRQEHWSGFSFRIPAYFVHCLEITDPTAFSPVSSCVSTTTVQTKVGQTSSNLKQSCKEPSGRRLEDGQPPPWSLETVDRSQVTNVHPSCIHKAVYRLCLQIGSIPSFVYSIIPSADIVCHSKLF